MAAAAGGAVHVAAADCGRAVHAAVAADCDGAGGAAQGLRTLVVATKALGDGEWAQWDERYQEAASDLDRRDQLVQTPTHCTAPHARAPTFAAYEGNYAFSSRSACVARKAMQLYQ